MHYVLHPHKHSRCHQYDMAIVKLHHIIPWDHFLHVSFADLILTIHFVFKHYPLRAIAVPSLGFFTLNASHFPNLGIENRFLILIPLITKQEH